MPNIFKVLSVSAILGFGFSDVVVAWERSDTTEGVLSDYLTYLRDINSAVLVSSCQVTDNIKAVLIFALGEVDADFLVILDKSSRGSAAIGGAGQVTFRDGAIDVLWTNGGDLQMQENYRHILANLSQSSFSLLQSDKLEIIYSAPSPSEC